VYVAKGINGRGQQPWRGLGIGLTVVIRLAFSCSPTIVLLQHVRIANIARVFGERISVPGADPSAGAGSPPGL
jgi:hypothetical protein